MVIADLRWCIIHAFKCCTKPSAMTSVSKSLHEAVFMSSRKQSVSTLKCIPSTRAGQPRRALFCEALDFYYLAELVFTLIFQCFIQTQILSSRL